MFECALQFPGFSFLYIVSSVLYQFSHVRMKQTEYNLGWNYSENVLCSFQFLICYTHYNILYKLHHTHVNCCTLEILG
jgi:hypothetical protein